MTVLKHHQLNKDTSITMGGLRVGEEKFYIVIVKFKKSILIEETHKWKSWADAHFNYEKEKRKVKK